MAEGFQEPVRSEGQAGRVTSGQGFYLGEDGQAGRVRGAVPLGGTFSRACLGLRGVARGPAGLWP